VGLEEVAEAKIPLDSLAVVQALQRKVLLVVAVGTETEIPTT
jgi:hypothetical protein